MLNNCRRHLTLSSFRRFPRTILRSSEEAVNSDGPVVMDDNNGKLPIIPKSHDHGEMIYDCNRKRTADPSVMRSKGSEKKLPKKTVKDIITETRKMRANYFKKVPTVQYEDGKLENLDGFYGIPAVDSSKNIIDSRANSQFVDDFEILSEDIDSSDIVVDKERSARIENRLLKSKDDINNFEIAIERSENEQNKSKNKARDGDEKYAFDVAMQMRRSLEGRHNIAKDSKGFRTMTGSVIDWEAVTNSDFFRIIRKSVVYNGDGIVAINKPYGLPVQGGPGVNMSVASCFKFLAHWLEKLKNSGSQTNSSTGDEPIWCRLAHRIDRDTTGVLLIATNQPVAAKLRFWFNERKVKKVYWAITKFIPKETEGIIDIPMYESEVSKNFYRMNLVPVSEAHRKQNATKAVTRYKVLDTNASSAALIECYPETGVKHQLRCHLGLGLATPILGDHKYSYTDSMKPQRLPSSVLVALGMRQAKARSVPLHLHAARIVLPEFVDGRTIAISARPPPFFIDTAKRLNLKLPHFLI